MTQTTIDDQIEKFRIKLLNRLRRDYPFIIWGVSRHNANNLDIVGGDLFLVRMSPEYFIIHAENNFSRIDFSLGSRIPFDDFPEHLKKQIEKDLTKNIRKIIKEMKEMVRNKNVSR